MVFYGFPELSKLINSYTKIKNIMLLEHNRRNINCTILFQSLNVYYLDVLQRARVVDTDDKNIWLMDTFYILKVK